MLRENSGERRRPSEWWGVRRQPTGTKARPHQRRNPIRRRLWKYEGEGFFERQREDGWGGQNVPGREPFRMRADTPQSGVARARERASLEWAGLRAGVRRGVLARDPHRRAAYGVGRAPLERGERHPETEPEDHGHPVVSPARQPKHSGILGSRRVGDVSLRSNSSAGDEKRRSVARDTIGA